MEIEFDKHCIGKHTAYQPTDEDWRCPKCGQGSDGANGGFTLDGKYDCYKLHTDDACMCYECGYEASGSVVAKLMMKKSEQIICPTCKGKGTVLNKDRRGKHVGD